MQLAGHIDSYYAASANRELAFQRLRGDLDADVCIVGGGYTGLFSAIHLREKGYSVVLLEAERVGWGASGRNGGHCGIGQRKDQAELEALVGVDQARRLWQLGLEAVATTCELVQRFNIDCDLKQGDLHVAARPEHVADMRNYALGLAAAADSLGTRIFEQSRVPSYKQNQGVVVNAASRPGIWCLPATVTC